MPSILALVINWHSITPNVFFVSYFIKTVKLTQSETEFLQETRFLVFDPNLPRYISHYPETQGNIPKNLPKLRKLMRFFDKLVIGEVRAPVVRPDRPRFWMNLV